MAPNTAALRRLRSNNDGAGSSDRVLFYVPGQAIAGESFTRPSSDTYIDVNGVLQTVGNDVKEDNSYVGAVRNTLLQATRTNVVLWCRDMTNAAWVKTNTTAAKDQTGIDGAANAASSLLATAANATCLQAIVLGSTARYQTVYVKRLIGAGTINMTMDNGVTWTAIALTAGYTRLSIPSQTLANPTVGFQIVTSGDKIAVDYVQNEAGAFETSPILTTVAAVQRSEEVDSMPFTLPPRLMTIYYKFIELGTIVTPPSPRLWQISSAANGNPRLFCFNVASNYRLQHTNSAAASVSSDAVGTPAKGDTVELLAVFFADGSVQLSQSINGAATTVGTRSAAQAVDSAWSGQLFFLNSAGSGAGSRGTQGLLSLKAMKGSRSMADMRAA